MPGTTLKRSLPAVALLTALGAGYAKYGGQLSGSGEAIAAPLIERDNAKIFVPVELG